MIRATTETGSVYTVDRENGFWKKNDGGYERIWDLRVGTTLTHPADDPENWERAQYPEVGKHMFIACRAFWYTTTKIVSIEELDRK